MTKLEVLIMDTIQKELDNNQLYLNFCNSEIQVLRALNGINCEFSGTRVKNDITPFLKVKSLQELTNILTHLLDTKAENVRTISREFEIQAEIQENVQAEIQSVADEQKIMFDFESSDEYRKVNDNNTLTN